MATDARALFEFATSRRRYTFEVTSLPVQLFLRSWEEAGRPRVNYEHIVLASFVTSAVIQTVDVYRIASRDYSSGPVEYRDDGFKAEVRWGNAPHFDVQPYEPGALVFWRSLPEPR